VRKPILVVGAVGVIIITAGWIAVNPAGRFGMSRDMLTTYNRLPVPFLDLQVRSDGTMRVVGKSHQIATEQLAWLARPEPEVLIIAGGWQGDARAAGPLDDFKGTRVLTLPTGKALELFNSLRERGVRVAIHVHSTC
jgi:hypothetical protein